MPLNPDAVNDPPGPPSERSWNSKDALLYAVGVGAGSIDPTGFELEFTTENSKDVQQRVLPTFAVIIGIARREPGDVQPGDARPRRAGDRAPRRDPGGRHRSARRRASPRCTTRARPRSS